MQEIARFIAALLRRNDLLTALPRLIIALLWGFQLLFFPFAAARVGSWLLVGETILISFWWCGSHIKHRNYLVRHGLWGLPVAGLLYTIWGRLDVACGLAVAIWAGSFALAVSQEKASKLTHLVTIVAGLAAVVFAWKAWSADFSDLAPVYAIYLLSGAIYTALKLKIKQ